ncbi:MAG: hypothetical protein QOG16_826, partial [Actinomycetota bacterium]|nr:hypothetical protein [Actinomycetota bacterium]
MWKSRQEQGFELQPGDRIATFTLGTKLGEGAVG